VILRDLSMLTCGHFAVLAAGVDNLTIDNLKIDTNRDGIDIGCCRNVRISNCSVNSPWDDAICPKSSFALGYARPTENVTIANCYVTGGYQVGSLIDGSFKPFPEPTKTMIGSAPVASSAELNRTADSRISLLRIASSTAAATSHSKRSMAASLRTSP
jgi:polygalacturonase